MQTLVETHICEDNMVMEQHESEFYDKATNIHKQHSCMKLYDASKAYT